MTLSRTVPFHDGETLVSYVARLAEVNAVRPSAFFKDMGLRRVSYDGKHKWTPAKLSELGGASKATLARSLFSISRYCVKFRGEKVSSRNLARRRPRVCPLCIKSDMQAAKYDGDRSGPWFRCQWLMPICVVCPHHGCLIGEPGPSLLATDETVQDLLRNHPGWLDEVCGRVAGGFDTRLAVYIDDRLNGKRLDDGYLNGLPLYAAVRLSQVVGATVLFGDAMNLGDMSYEDAARAGAAGFEIANHGLEEFIVPLLEQKTHGESRGVTLETNLFLTWLNGTARNTDYRPVRELVQEIAIQCLPIGPGNDFLGPVTTRSFHSLRTACEALDVRPNRMRVLLSTHGILPDDLAREEFDRTLFPAEQLAPIAALVRRYLTATQARIHLGMGYSHMKDCEALGLITPAPHILKGKTVNYDVQTLDEFLAKILVEKGSGGELEYASELRPRDKSSVCVWVVKMLLAGQLKRVAIDTDRTGFAGVMVDAAEARDKHAQSTPRRLGAREVAMRLEIPPRMAIALMEQGTLPSQIVSKRHDGSIKREVTTENFDRFKVKYATIHEIADRMEVGWRTAWESAVAAGIYPAFDYGKGSGLLFLRSDIPRITGIYQ